jgi:bifunctional aspartokinase / homoserine dehydrogenase 1
MGQSSWVVHKFGGTSVANTDRYKDVAKLVQAERANTKAVVVSAMSGVTNQLLDLIERAIAQDSEYLNKLDELKRRHLQTLSGLVSGKPHSNLATILETDFEHLKEMLRGIWLARSSSSELRDLISGHGEIWSAQLIDAYLRSQNVSSMWLDARKVLVVKSEPTRALVDWQKSQTKLDAWLLENKPTTLVITGFIASTPEGLPTTLKRNGSDFTASIFGSLLKANAITIWTDVDGVYTADPRLVPEAVVLKELSYSEATELAYFGAKVVHPSTMAPAIKDSIPIWIRNTFHPEAAGTKIHSSPQSDRPVAGFATIDDMALLNIEGTGMIGVPGIAERLFGALKEVGVSVVMISQASSEHSICFAIPRAQVEIAKNTVEKTFYGELHQAQIQAINVTPDCSILAIVGDNMAQKPGVAGRFLGALGKAGVNIRAIAQGSSERNISAVIDGKESTKAVRATHAAFYLSPQTISIGVIGCGLIGGTLLDQLGSQLNVLKENHNIDLRVRALSTSKKMLLQDQGAKLQDWRETLARDAKDLDLKSLVAHLKTEYIPHTVIIDCTASEEIPQHYISWLEQGIHIITPNKKGNGGPVQLYKDIRSAARSASRHVLCQTTVGGGLPILTTLRDLVKTGDQILQIEGVLSGTLAYLFNTFDGERPFSESVKDARSKGFTEPDPRDDLSGMDVARKCLIMAREIGYEMELSHLQVQNLVPESLRRGSIDDFLRDLTGMDAEMTHLLSKTKERNEVLRYVGTVNPTGKSTVELKAYPKTHPFASLSGSDNIVAFRTQRYHSHPLIIRGPGAGPEVTAGGVFADLLRLVNYVGGAT